MKPYQYSNIFCSDLDPVYPEYEHLNYFDMKTVQDTKGKTLLKMMISNDYEGYEIYLNTKQTKELIQELQKNL